MKKGLLKLGLGGRLGNSWSTTIASTLLLGLTGTVLALDCSPSGAPSVAGPDGRISGALVREYADWCESCGGTFIQHNGARCEPGSNWGGGGVSNVSPSVYPSGGYPTTVNEAILQGVQQGIQQGLRNAAERRRQQQQQAEINRAITDETAEAMAENARRNARLIEQQNRAPSTKAKRAEVQQSDEILSQMRGSIGAGTQALSLQLGQSPSLQPKDLASDSATEACLHEEDFNTYQARETERRGVLGKVSNYPAGNRAMKARADWCGLHIPLPPSPYATGYCQKKPVYESRMVDWRKRCAVVAETPSVPPLAPAGSGKAREPSAVPDCLGVYDNKANACLPNDLNLFANCINGAIRDYLGCQKPEPPDMTEVSDARRGAGTPSPAVPGAPPPRATSTPGPLTADEWRRARQTQARIDALYRKIPHLSAQEIAELKGLESARDGLWRQVAASPDLTEDERLRLRLNFLVDTSATQVWDSRRLADVSEETAAALPGSSALERMADLEKYAQAHANTTVLARFGTFASGPWGAVKLGAEATGEISARVIKMTEEELNKGTQQAIELWAR